MQSLTNICPVNRFNKSRENVYVEYILKINLLYLVFKMPSIVIVISKIECVFHIIYHVNITRYKMQDT